MVKNFKLKPPFFEIGPKTYAWGQDIIDLALAADEISERYDVDIIFTAAYTELEKLSSLTKRLFIFAPHMDAINPGRGIGAVLPEAVQATGAAGVMLNHAEKPITYDELRRSIARADELGLATIVCANSLAEIKSIALLAPNIIVAEPTELIGTGQTSDLSYVRDSIRMVKAINPDILVLQGAGISSGADVYRTIRAGAEATGSSSGIMKAADRIAMVEEMIAAARKAYDECQAEEAAK